MQYVYRGKIYPGKEGEGGSSISPNRHRRTPDHPPYSEVLSLLFGFFSLSSSGSLIHIGCVLAGTKQMVEKALRALGEEGGSTQSSISAFIRSSHANLPWGHDRLLPYYLRRLVTAGELISPLPDRYQLPLEPPSPSRRGRSPFHHSKLCSHPSSLSWVRGNGRPRSRRGRGMPPLSKVMPFYFYGGRGRQSHRSRGRGTPPHRSRGRGTPPHRSRGRGNRSRGRGNPSLHRQGSTLLCFRTLGGTMLSQNAVMSSNEEELYCSKANDHQSAVFTFCGEGLLVDPQQSELDLEHEHSSLVIKGSTMMEYELCVPGKKQSPCVEWATSMNGEYPELGREQCSLARELSWMVDEQSTEPEHEQCSQVKEPILMLDEPVDSGHGLSSKEPTLTVEEYPEFGHERYLLIERRTSLAVPDQCDLGNGQFSAIKELSQLGNESSVTPELGIKESLPLVVPQKFELGTGESFHGEEQSMAAIVDSVHGQGMLLSELHEQAEQVQKGAPKYSMDCLGKFSSDGPSWVATEEPEHGKYLSLLPFTGLEDVGKGIVSRTGKQRKSSANQRRLWFEGC